MVRQYIGARYVPRVVGVHNLANEYENLDVVYSDSTMGTSYISKKPVPVGVPLTNTEYWTLFGSTTGAITELQERMTQAENDIDDVPKYYRPCVNVKEFGAVGDATFYAIGQKKFFNGYKGAPATDDTEAILRAIEYAEEHDICDIYFPIGGYLIKGERLTLNISKHRFVGEGQTAICSEGLVNGAFITLTSPIDLNQYNKVRNPLENISIWGSYNDGDTITGVTGLAISGATTFNGVHSIISNVVIKDFNIGIDINQGYKMTYNNCTFLANGIGVNMNPNAPIPIYFNNCYLECNRIALTCQSSGWANAIFNSCCFEYNRNSVLVGSGFKFIGCRFEIDPLSKDDTNAIFTTGKDCACFACDFLLLPNYVSNVSNWIVDPSRFLRDKIGTDFIFADGIDWYNCNIGLDASIQRTAGTYLIGVIGAKFGCYNCKKSGTNIVNPANYKELQEAFTDM